MSLTVHEAAAERLAALKSDDEILWGVVANAGRGIGTTTRWGAVMEATGMGSTAAHLLCVRFGFDPDERVGTDPETEDEA